MTFVKAPTTVNAKSEYERLVARVGRHLRENGGKPIHVAQPILVVQRLQDGTPFAALCTHFADGVTPEIAIQNLICQLTGGSVEKDSSTQGGDQNGA